MQGTLCPCRYRVKLNYPGPWFSCTLNRGHGRTSLGEMCMVGAYFSSFLCVSRLSAPRESRFLILDFSRGRLWCQGLLAGKPAAFLLVHLSLSHADVRRENKNSQGTIMSDHDNTKRGTLTESDLRQFTGDLVRYRTIFPNIIYTPGVQFLAKKGEAYWLIDAIASYFGAAQLQRALKKDARLRSLQFWRLKVKPDSIGDTHSPSRQRREALRRTADSLHGFPPGQVSIWVGFDGRRSGRSTFPQNTERSGGPVGDRLVHNSGPCGSCGHERRRDVVLQIRSCRMGLNCLPTSS